MRTSEAIDKIIPAFVKAQAMIAPAMKDAKNDHFKSKYADLAAVWEACRGPLSGAELCVNQDVELGERGVSVTTRLWHASGQWLEFGPLVVPLAKQDAHGVGSGVTYGRRFSLCAALGIVAEEDDDGNGATGKPAGKTFVERMPGGSTQTTPSPKGISNMREQVNQAVGDIGASTDWDTLEGWLMQPSTKALMVKTCLEFTSLWRGDEPGSGLAGCLEVAGDQLGKAGEVADYLGKVEKAAADRKVA
jgi:hypothetical protein